MTAQPRLPLYELAADPETAALEADFTKADHLALRNTIEHMGGCRAGQCWTPCQERRALLIAAAEWIEARRGRGL